jgi:hypothetical protein
MALPEGRPLAGEALPPGRRIAGIDVARGLAVLGMMTAHVGPEPGGGPPGDGFLRLADGRPAALFVVLAGISLALLSGGVRPAVGRDLARARARIVGRALVVLVIGLALDALGTPVLVILPTYAVLFAVGCLVLSWRPWLLVVSAVVVALVAPPVRTAIGLGTDTTDPGGLVGVLVGPHYPALVWFAYLLAGLAVGRLDVTRPAVQRRLAGVGAALVVLGYTGGWVAQSLGAPYALASIDPHSSTTFEVVGNTGVALVVIAGSLAVAQRWPRLVAPLAAVGALALTAYSVHVVVIALVGTDVVWQPTVSGWLAFLGTTTVLCWLWRATLGRGPLERVMALVSTGVADLLVPQPPDDAVRRPEAHAWVVLRTS